MLKLMASLLLAAIVATGCGAGSIFVIPRILGAAPGPAGTVAKKADAAKKAESPKPHGEKAGEGKAGETAADQGKDIRTLIELPPIVSALAAPAGMWARFEGAALIEPMEAGKAIELRARLSDDFVSYFASLTLLEMEGPVGLKSVREDLIERARLRSGGKVREIMIQTLVAQ